MRPLGPIQQAKRDLRRAVLARRDALPRAELVAKSRLITQRIEALPEYQNCRVVAGYATFGSEVLTRPFLQRALSAGRSVLLPRVDPEHRRLTWHHLPAWKAQYLAPGPWRIPEPRPSLCPEVDILTADFLLCPGVAFDLRGRRLGYGGGFYDAVLSLFEAEPDCRSVVAAAFELQIVDRVPRTRRDRLVPLLVTEARVIRTGNTPSRRVEAPTPRGDS